MNAPKPMRALVDVHGVVFKLTAADGSMTAERFRLFVLKVRRMGLIATEQDAEAMRDELLILDAFGKGVSLVSLLSYHPISAATAGEKEDAALIMIKTFDPNIHVTPTPEDA